MNYLSHQKKVGITKMLQVSVKRKLPDINAYHGLIFLLLVQCKNCSITVNGQTMGSEMTAPPNAPTTPTNAPTTTIASMQTAPVTMPPMATNPMTMPPMTAMTEPPTEETNRG